MPYSIEEVIFVYDDKSGSKVYVGPDADCSSLVELRQYDEDNKIVKRINFTVVEALMVADSIIKLYRK